MRSLLVAVLLIAGAALWAWLDTDDGVETWRSLHREVADAQARVARTAARNHALRAEIEALRADPFEQERAVREELRWARPGEMVLRTPDREASLALGGPRGSLP